MLSRNLRYWSCRAGISKPTPSQLRGDERQDSIHCSLLRLASVPNSGRIVRSIPRRCSMVAEPAVDVVIRGNLLRKGCCRASSRFWPSVGLRDQAPTSGTKLTAAFGAGSSARDPFQKRIEIVQRSRKRSAAVPTVSHCSGRHRSSAQSPSPSPAASPYAWPVQADQSHERCCTGPAPSLDSPGAQRHMDRRRDAGPKQ
jgi:hypothetical protein